MRIRASESAKIATVSNADAGDEKTHGVIAGE